MQETTQQDEATLALLTLRATTEAESVEAEVRKLRAEVDKLATGQLKIRMEAEALHPWRQTAIFVGVSVLLAVIGGAVGSLIARH